MCLNLQNHYILLDPVMELIPEGLKILYFVNNLVWTAAEKFGKFGNRKIGAGSDIDPAFYNRIQGRIRDTTLNGTAADIDSSFFQLFFEVHESASLLHSLFIYYRQNDKNQGETI